MKHCKTIKSAQDVISYVPVHDLVNVNLDMGCRDWLHRTAQHCIIRQCLFSGCCRKSGYQTLHVARSEQPLTHTDCEEREGGEGEGDERAR